MRTATASKTSFNSGKTERRPRTAPAQVMAVALAASALAFGADAFAPAKSSPGASAAIAAAVADSSRPGSDTEHDAERKPQQSLAFAGVKPGDRVADYVAENGYFTRLFSSVVGPNGHVYAVQPTAFFRFKTFPPAVAELEGYAVTHPNVTVTTAAALDGLNLPEKLDLFWISRNYHDLHDKFMGPVDTAAFNKAVYKALKPGGVYVVLDHSAVPGAPADVTDTLHRIESSTVRREVEAAGFKFVAEGGFLRNPADPRDKETPDPPMPKDEFVLKFVKP